MGIQDWSAADIDKARSCFLKGLSIKDIAREVGRSTTATNKALSRFGIRFEKPRRNYLEHSVKPKDKINLPLAAPSFEHTTLRKEFENWVSFWHLCEFLSSQNIRIFEISPSNTELEKRCFKLDTKILTARQLVIIANKIRTQNNMKAFFVKGLSW